MAKPVTQRIRVIVATETPTALLFIQCGLRSNVLNLIPNIPSSGWLLFPPSPPSLRVSRLSSELPGCSHHHPEVEIIHAYHGASRDLHSQVRSRLTGL